MNDVKPKPLVETLQLQTVGVMLIRVQVKTVIGNLASKLIKENAKTVSTNDAISKQGSGQQPG